MVKKQNISLIIGLSIPIVMIVLIGVSIYLPALFVKPKVNFLYAYAGDYYAQQKYSVKNGKLIKAEIKYPENNNYQYKKEDPALFIYDVSTDRAREIVFEDAQRLKLNRYHKSVDGFQVVSGGSGGDIFGLFYRSHYGEHYLKKGAFSKQLMIDANKGRYNYTYFKFLGWIEE